MSSEKLLLTVHDSTLDNRGKIWWFPRTGGGQQYVNLNNNDTKRFIREKITFTVYDGTLDNRTITGGPLVMLG